MSDQGVPARLLDLARRARVPQELSNQGLRVRFGDPADAVIGVGQVWLAHWEDVTALLLIVASDGRNVLGVPISIDPPGEDEGCVVISPVLTVFPIDVTVWMGMERTVPIRVLERQVDQWDEEIPHLLQLWSRDGGDLPSGMRSGHQLSDEFDASALVRAEIADDLDALIDAPGLPTARPGEQRQDLASLLRGKVDLPALCTALRLTQPEVMTILRGKAPMTADQIVVVASVTGLTNEEIAQSVRPLPLELVVEAEHPRWRLTWQHNAQAHGVSEAEARLTASYGAYALAARETRVSEPNWDQRLREFLRDEAEPTSAP